MAVLRRLNLISQELISLPMLRSIESAVSSDFDQLIQALVTGTSQGYVIRGYNISMNNAIGSASNSLQMIVDPGAVLAIAASQSGTILMTPPGTPPQTLNPATNSNVNGAFTPSSVNYVTLDLVRFIDPTTAAQTGIWDPTSNTQTNLIAPTAIILEFVIDISTNVPAPNQLPLAIVVTDPGNLVVSITDARWMFASLSTGGLSPNLNYSYPWTQGRTANPETSTSDSVDPFSGGDKNIGSLKEWMNAVMTSFKEIKGTAQWFNAGGSYIPPSPPSPFFNSDIRGFPGDNVYARIGYLTDAIGDEQEDRTAVIMSASTVSWIGSDLTFSSNIVFQIINAKMGGITNHIVTTANSPLNVPPGYLAYITIDRFLTTENLVPVVTNVPLPAQTELNKDIIVLFENIGGNLWMPFMKQMVGPSTTFTIGEIGGGTGFDVNDILVDRNTGEVVTDRNTGNVVLA